MRYAFYVSGNATRLFKFLKQCKPELLSKIKFVFSDDSHNCYLEELLHEMKTNFFLYDYALLPKDKDRNEVLSNQLLYKLQEYSIDYCFSFGNHILKGEIIRVYKHRIINFHPSLLPNFPGRKAIDQAVRASNQFIIGNTAHIVDEGMDTGEVIMQSVMPIERFYQGGYDAIMDVQVEMLKKIMEVIENGRLQFVEGKAVIKNADYFAYEIFPRV